MKCIVYDSEIKHDFSLLPLLTGLLGAVNTSRRRRHHRVSKLLYLGARIFKGSVTRRSFGRSVRPTASSRVQEDSCLAVCGAGYEPSVPTTVNTVSRRRSREELPTRMRYVPLGT